VVAAGRVGLEVTGWPDGAAEMSAGGSGVVMDGET
jgi:hypothetical protein